MSDWLEALCNLRDENTSFDTPYQCVLINTIQAQGSSPRDIGTRMLVTTDQCVGTIGGGHLEYQAIQMARDMLGSNASELRIERFALGARLGQCCGGSVSLAFHVVTPDSLGWINTLRSANHNGMKAILLTPSAQSSMPKAQKLVITADETWGHWPDQEMQNIAVQNARKMLNDPSEHQAVWQDKVLYESSSANKLHIAIFGAGHVGKALVHTLSALPCQLVWVDSRAGEYPNEIPKNVTKIVTDYPEDEVADLPTNTHVVIMTHSHALDQKLCEVSLKQDNLGSCSLIGSQTKRALFERRLKNKGVSSQELESLICPIGVQGIDSKHPTAIAIAVAAQILMIAQQSNQPQWHDNKMPEKLIDVT